MKNYSVKLDEHTANVLKPFGISTEIRRRVVDYDRIIRELRGMTPVLTLSEALFLVAWVQMTDLDSRGISMFDKSGVLMLLSEHRDIYGRTIAEKMKDDDFPIIGVYALLQLARMYNAYGFGVRDLYKYIRIA